MSNSVAFLQISFTRIQTNFQKGFFHLMSKEVIPAYKTKTAAWLVFYRTYQKSAKGTLQDSHMGTLINYCQNDNVKSATIQYTTLF